MKKTLLSLELVHLVTVVMDLWSEWEPRRPDARRPDAVILSDFVLKDFLNFGENDPGFTKMKCTSTLAEPRILILLYCTGKLLLKKSSV